MKHHYEQIKKVILIMNTLTSCLTNFLVIVSIYSVQAKSDGIPLDASTQKDVASNDFLSLCDSGSEKSINIYLSVNTKYDSLNDVRMHGKCALHILSKRGFTRCINSLIQYGFNVNVRDDSGNTSLHIAVQNQKNDIIKLLILNKADPNLSNNVSETPLHIGARLGNLDIVSVLVNSGAKVDAVSNNGKSALHLAVDNGNIYVIKYLADAGSNINLQDSTKLSPRDIAIKKGMHIFNDTLLSELSENNMTDFEKLENYMEFSFFGKGSAFGSSEENTDSKGGISLGIYYLTDNTEWSTFFNLIDMSSGFGTVIENRSKAEYGYSILESKRSSVSLNAGIRWLINGLKNIPEDNTPWGEIKKRSGMNLFLNITPLKWTDTSAYYDKNGTVNSLKTLNESRLVVVQLEGGYTHFMFHNIEQTISNDKNPRIFLFLDVGPSIRWVCGDIIKKENREFYKKVTGTNKTLFCGMFLKFDLRYGGINIAPVFSYLRTFPNAQHISGLTDGQFYGSISVESPIFTKNIRRNKLSNL